MTPHAGTDTQEREVAGAAAEVADQNQFVVVEGGLVGAGGGNRLHLEVDAFESRRL